MSISKKRINIIISTFVLITLNIFFISIFIIVFQYDVKKQNKNFELANVIELSTDTLYKNISSDVIIKYRSFKTAERMSFVIRKDSKMSCMSNICMYISQDVPQEIETKFGAGMNKNADLRLVFNILPDSSYDHSSTNLRPVVFEAHQKGDKYYRHNF